MDQVNFSAWVDRSDVAEGAVSDQAARMIHAVVNTPDGTAPRQGDPLPPLWHWCAFSPTNAMEDLREDGHPQLSDFMPPVPLNRRMWAGGNIEFLAPLHVGEPLRKRTTIVNVSEKSGATGDMVLVNLDHEIHGASGLAVLERQDIVYLQIPERFTPPQIKTPPTQPDAHREVVLSTPLLFRYSAITFNAHRIHYDLAYTQQIEKYPDLVVHGPLQAQLLMNMAYAERGAPPKMFAYRGVYPLFAGDQLSLTAVKKSTSEWALCTVADGARQTTQANAMWEI